MNIFLKIYIGTIIFMIFAMIVCGIQARHDYICVQNNNRLIGLVKIIIVALIPIFNVIVGLSCIFRYEDVVKTLIDNGTIVKKEINV